ncbi:MAG: universal stress protein [Corynebacterium sp.]|nr:universal stress protein [Corynebacterium sp.]
MAKKSLHSHSHSLREAPAQPLRVLVSWTPATGGSEAIQLAAWLAKITPVKVRVVTTFAQPWHEVSLQKLGGKYKKWFKQEAAACEQAVENTLVAAGIPREYWDKHFSVLVDGPNISQMLTQSAEDFKADVVALGPGQSAPKGRFLAGSVADTLLHYSPTPLALSPRAVKLAKNGPTRINFAFTDDHHREDFSALFDAARTAALWKLPLRILTFSANDAVNAPVNDKLDVAKELTTQWREQTMATLDVAQEEVADVFPELEITTDIGAGRGWRAAVESLKWKKGDILFLGSTPMGALERVFIGSHATELLPHVSVPVFVSPVHKATKRQNTKKK